MGRGVKKGGVPHRELVEGVGGRGVPVSDAAKLHLIPLLHQTFWGLPDQLHVQCGVCR